MRVESRKNSMNVSPEEVSQQPLSFEGLTMRVENLERSLAFYMSIPGAQLLFHKEGIVAQVRIGNGRIGLLQQPAAPLFHLEFETTGELEALVHHFQEIGVDKVKKPTQKKWGEIDFTMRDPDGNILEFEAVEQFGSEEQEH